MANTEIWVLLHQSLAKTRLECRMKLRMQEECTHQAKKGKEIDDDITILTKQSLLTSEPQSDFWMCSRARAISHANDDLTG